MGKSGVASCCDSGDVRPVELALPVAFDSERSDAVEQFSGLEQEIGVGWSAPFRLFDRERFIDEHSAGTQSPNQRWKKRTVQIPKSEDGVKGVRSEVLAITFEVFHCSVDREIKPGGNPIDSVDFFGIPIDGTDLKSRCGEQQGMASVPAGQIEQETVAGQEIAVFQEPRGGANEGFAFGWRMFARSVPGRHASREVEQMGEPGCGQEADSLYAADAVFADNEQGFGAVGEGGGATGDQLHRKQGRTRDVPELLELTGRADVENMHTAGGDQSDRFTGIHIGVAWIGRLHQGRGRVVPEYPNTAPGGLSGKGVSIRVWL